MTSPYLFYLYCIFESGTEAKRWLEERCIPGLEPEEPLFPVEAAGLVAAVSRVPGETFQEEPLHALLKELPRLAPFALRHDEAIRALLPLAPALVPMTLGAVYRSPQKVADLLQERAPLFQDLLASLRGKQEWGVKVFRDNLRLLEAAANSDQLRRLAEEAAQSGPGKAYLIRKQRERLLLNEAERLASQSLEVILQDLTAVSDAVHVDEVPATQPSSLPLALKASFLVEASMVEAFRSVAVGLEGSYAPLGLHLELNGPWAPYSFVANSAARPEAGP